jgi:hypothetical protein
VLSIVCGDCVAAIKVLSAAGVSSAAVAGFAVLVLLLANYHSLPWCLDFQTL